MQQTQTELAIYADARLFSNPIPLMPHRRKSRILLWLLVALFVFAVIGTIAFLTVPAPLEAWLQGQILVALREHYQRDVQLQNLHVTLIPNFYATADNFVVPSRPGLPPFLSAKHLTVEGNILGLLFRSPIHLSWLKLDGFEIHVPPKSDAARGGKPRQHTRLANFVIDKVEADGTELYVLRKDPAREPLRWDIRKLTLTSAGVGQPMKFEAELSNPTPPGIIVTSGRFGPWNLDQPSATRVGGHYDFQHADLSVFNGISGMLSSAGDYDGVLQNIVVDGTTDVPDFQLDRGGHPVHLTTKFHAVVDGTNGNTYLQPVEAHFLNSNISVVKGEVAGRPGEKGKTIALDIEAQGARVEDVLALASKSEPAMLTGSLKLESRLTLPPGNEPVLQRMLLEGTFRVSDARFASDTVRKVITELSRRGQGNPADQSPQDVPAEFIGDFSLLKTKLTFHPLQFLVPGAATRMQGSYGLHDQQLNFVGDVRLDARVSEMLPGAPQWLTIPLDLIFTQHGAGTYLPISITGTREQPQIKVNWKKIFNLH